MFTFQREIIRGAIIYITKDLFILIKHSTLGGEVRLLGKLS